MAQSLVTTGEQALGLTAPHQLPAMAYRIGARSARVGDDGYRAAESEGLLQVQRLALRLIMNHAGRLSSARLRRPDGLSIHCLAQAHLAAGCPKNQRNILGRF